MLLVYCSANDNVQVDSKSKEANSASKLSIWIVMNNINVGRIQYTSRKHVQKWHVNTCSMPSILKKRFLQWYMKRLFQRIEPIFNSRERRHHYLKKKGVIWYRSIIMSKNHEKGLLRALSRLIIAVKQKIIVTRWLPEPQQNISFQ